MMQRNTLSIILFLLAAATLSAEPAATPQNVFARKHQSLNGKWSYIVDVQEMGYYDYRRNPIPYGFFLNAKPQRPTDLIEYDFDAAPRMTVPGDWNTQDERLFFYEGTVWFQRYFQYSPVAGRRALLYFAAVNYEALVFVNGKKVGEHRGGFTPFCFDVTDQLHEGENFVIVKVDNRRRKENVPTLIFDWWNYGGITRDVLLVDVADNYLCDYTLQLAKGSSDTMNFTARLQRLEAGKKIELSIPELKIRRTFTTDANGTVTASLKKKNIKLWSPVNPKLYQVEIACEGETIDDEIGFRTIETRGKQLLLNGEPIFLNGVCMHEEKPYVQGRANGCDDARTSFTWAKELGCNFMRLAHYPHNEHAIREAERMGILLWSEIPVYWTIDWENPDTYKVAEQQLTEMITRDRNRANIIIWSIANETPHGDARDSFLSRLATKARQLDGTRLVSMAMEVLSAKDYVNRLQDNLHEQVDVVSFNQYVGWYRDVNDAPKMKWEVPYEKPVIVSEFGGGALAGLHGERQQRWTEEFQAELYRQNLAMLSKIDGLAGLTPWVLVDFRSPRRPLDGVQDYFNRKGLVSDKGEKKEAFKVLQEFYNNKR